LVKAIDKPQFELETRTSPLLDVATCEENMVATAKVDSVRKLKSMEGKTFLNSEA
jgi:hypothetical protein